MTVDLDGCRTKMARAHTHAQDLQRRLDAIRDADPYAVRREFDVNDPHKLRLRLLKDIEPPPIEIGAIIGDIAYNLHSALDQLVCVLATLAHTDCEETLFPIHQSATGKRSFANGKRRIAGLIKDHRDIIEDLQPYKRSATEPTIDPLWWLYCLSNIDKHRRIHVVLTVLRDFVYATQGVRTIDAYFQATKAGEDIVYFTLTDPPDHQVKVVLPPSIEFGPGSDVLTGIEVRQVITRIFWDVEQNVFPKFEPWVGSL